MREMKDSGVAWIGEIPKSWNLERLQWHISEIKETNKPEKTKQILSLTNKRGVIPYEEKGAQGNVSKEDLSQYKLAYPDTIVANSMNVLIGSVGKCNYYGCVSPVYYVYKPNDGENLEFINYIFQTEQFQKELRRYANGILEIRLRVSSDGILKRKVAFPSTDEQQKIVVYLNQKLSQVDSLIANVQAQIEKLKAYKQSLITEVVTKGLDPNAPMKDSGVDWIGQVPMHWHIVKLKYITEISRGLFNHRPRNDPSLYGGKYPFIQTGDVARAQKFITSYSQTLNERGKEVSKLFPKGTMTMTIAANVGDVAILGFDAYFPDSVVGFTVRKDYNEDYVYYLFQALKESFIRASIVSTQLNLNIERSKEILAPTTYNICEQKAIADFLDDKCSQIERLVSLKESKIEKLQQYKRSLIYEYVTGKKEVV